LASEDFITVMNGAIAKKRIKIEILDSNKNVIDSISPTLISGDITLSSGSGSRRSCNLLLDNSDGQFIPSASTIWLNSLFKVYTGYDDVDSVEEFESRGIFLLGEPEIASAFSEKTASLSLYDQNANLNGELSGVLESPYIINSGTTIDAAVRQILIEAGDLSVPIIAPTTETLPYSILKNPGDTFGSVLQELADMISWNYFYDRFGYFRFEPPTNCR
jgi:hypothetical protein